MSSVLRSVVASSLYCFVYSPLFQLHDLFSNYQAMFSVENKF